MSFSTDVKTELSSLKYLSCCSKAELSALFHIGGSIELNREGLHLIFQSTNLAVIRRVISLTKSLFGIELTLISKKQAKLQKRDLFFVRIAEKINQILTGLSLINQNGLFFIDLDPELIKEECDKRAYLRGAFLAGGSINSPDTASYHLEIQTFSEHQGQIIANLANEFSLNAKITKNRRGMIVYIKEAEKIADFLRVVDATNSLFTFEDSRIKRDFKNSINRVINCDIANEKKALDAAEKQLEQIKIVEEHVQGQLSKGLLEAIRLRKTYPEATLSELSRLSEELLGTAISKSALNHRYRAIKELADPWARKNESK